MLIENINWLKYWEIYNYKEKESLNKIIKGFVKNLEKLNNDERKIIKYELNYLTFSNEILVQEIGMNKNDVQRIEGAALLKVGCILFKND